MEEMKLVAEKIFDIKDQLNFASISADYNPLHMDIVYSRKSQFGKPVVHGINLLLWSINNAYENNSISYYPTKLNVQFLSALTIDSSAQVFIKQISGDRKEVLLEVRSEKTLILKAHLETSDYTPTDNTEPKNILKKTNGNNVSINETENKAGFVNLGFDMKRVRNLYPELTKIVSPTHLAAIIATSRIVGMECPGLLAVYSSLNLQFSQEKDEDRLNYNVVKTDPRFRLVSMDISGGGVNGHIEAFVRAKITDASCLDLKKILQPKEFSGQKVLIIGGNRGIGGATSKLLASGGADVMLTYHSCEDDAKQIVNEIRDQKDRADYIQFDITKCSDGIRSVLPKNWLPTHLYYFATPKILATPRGSFSSELHNTFNKYYIDCFYKIVAHFAGTIKSSLKVFYPSTVFIDEMPTDMTEYCVSKAGGEMVCRMIEKEFPHVAIRNPRLPKVMTYQTESFLPGKKLSPETIMLPYLREMK